jgi:secreted trypsin-like serine protease
MIGANDRSENEPESVRMSTRTKYVHSGFRILTLVNDIAILKLPQNVTLSGKVWIMT